MGVVTSQITSLTIVYSIVYSGADQGKLQSSASLAFVREFPAQMASNTENVSIWWRHHDDEQYVCDLMTSVYDNIKWTIISLGIVTVDRGDDLRLILNHKYIQERQGRWCIFDTGWSHWIDYLVKEDIMKIAWPWSNQIILVSGLKIVAKSQSELWRLITNSSAKSKADPVSSVYAKG